jgi:hypothetical protein
VGIYASTVILVVAGCWCHCVCLHPSAHCYCGVRYVGVSSVALVPSIAGVLAVAGVLTVASIPADPVVLAGVLTYCTVQCTMYSETYKAIGQSDAIDIFYKMLSMR